MSTWTTISDTVLEPGKPIRSVDALALRDNPVAIAAGASGAPRIVTNAIQDANVTTAKLATNERMTTANVLAATAGASVGAVGSYAFLGIASTFETTAAGATRAGSNLRYAGLGLTSGNWGSSASTNVQFVGNGGTPAGTWRAMGKAGDFVSPGSGSNSAGASLWLRIS
jgi:hypothetical protein